MIKYILLGIYIGLTIPAVLMMFAGIGQRRVTVVAEESADDKDESEEDPR